ncbi:hypothetical protein KXW40_003773 [Aspergillus fumigatus]|nr:hypothetical protein KXX22_007925 [Aspergillus fumigatus]KAH1445202.1 hypothetical protein KXX68_007550 [Aspergillus fumigatus]KAH1544817.1 hypothetical protein KXX37_003803 [Aspergillus fumigatus]KAH1843074.1 hypothetical protein KXX43_007746 [Aspergillus fumigatus]KAH2363755.1 hypothetical protein KXV41_003600 [Aspergillus fumigatus]
MNQSLRRLLPAEPPQSTLDWDQVDGILRYLDSLESVINSSSEEVNANIQNFGVFSLASASCPPPVHDPSTTAPYMPKDFQLENGYELNFDPDPVLIESESSHDNSEAEAAWNLCNLHGEQLPLDFPPQQDLAPSAISVPPGIGSTPSDPSDNAVGSQPFEVGALLFLEDANSRLPNKAAQALPTPTHCLENLEVPSQERLLMGHYRNRVVNLFCVIDNAKSPWKTIHLARVLQCAGELSFGGTTTRIRDALRKTLLSISAFYLSNDCRARHRNDEAESWGTVASRYRCDAIGLLKYAVETDLYADKRPKYKEFLATMLSMVTINVMSGDTSTCSVHLDGAERLINHMEARKSTFSRKAQSLHRIYLYLRVIYESTAVRKPRCGVSRFSPSLGSQKTFGPQPAVPRSHLLIEEDTTPSSMMPMAPNVLESESPISDMSTYECIYGIPQNLLILLKESIELIDEVNSYRSNPDTLSIPESLSQACDELEQKIMDWPLHKHLNRCKMSKNSTSATIIYHQTRAFLNALIIFFSQGVRLMSHRYLRQYVEAILDSIEAIEQLKAETKILAAPLFWPAFMGATEAFEPRHQERFRQWASVLHVPAWRRFSQSSSRIEQKVLPNACSRAKGRDWRIVSAIVAVVTSLAGYGVSKIPNGDANVPNRMTGVLDPERLPPVKYATLEDMKKAIAEIEYELRDTEDIISTDDEDLKMHGFSEWSSVKLDTLPIAVAYPRNTDQVSTIARICHKWKVPIIPYSGGSSLEGHTAAPFGGVSMDFMYMDQIIKINEDDMDVVVQPSVQWVDLNEKLKQMGSGLFFPMDPAPSAKIGGMISTNCSGTNAVRYGTMRDWVINLTVVLADGTVIKTRQRPRKCSAGYNLTGLFVGSEGTLGIVTEATLKLAVLPENYSVAVVPFNTIHDAVSAATKVIRKGIPVAALELMDETQMRIVNNSGVTRPRVWKESPTLFFKFAGSKAMLDETIQNVKQIVEAHGSEGFEFARDEQEQALLWSARKESLYSLLALRKDGEEMSDIIVASKQEAGALGLNACVKGHVGDGNFHENITYDSTRPEEVEKAKSAVKNMVQRAIEMEGTCTGEHGIGFGKKEALQQEVGSRTLSCMKILKASFDPHWIMYDFNSQP